MTVFHRRRIFVLIVIGSARALPGRRADLVSAARAVATQSRADEGCESYGFYADLTDDETILSVEIWRDQAALDAHMEHPHTQEFLAAAGSLVDGTPTMRFHTVAD
ncbi:putative quinol monooxygenase [Streptomyces sp. NBC_00019]|uniref:putative quinol monooxygenase n=1 Tax=Streptomyces sp. NBC_00019 TaxID=2975623 RepID=UPI00324A30FA